MEHFRTQPRFVDRPASYGDVQGAVLESLDWKLERSIVKLDQDIGKLLPKPAQNARKNAERARRREPDS